MISFAASVKGLLSNLGFISFQGRLKPLSTIYFFN